jgi:hypothetical protein
MGHAGPQNCEGIRGQLQDQLEDILSSSHQEQLKEHLSGCEPCSDLSVSLLQIHKALSIPPVSIPSTLHAQIMTGIEEFRQRELLYRRGSLLLLVAATILFSFAYQESLGFAWGAVQAVPGEFSELVRPWEFWEGLSLDWQLATGDASMPLACLILLPFFVLVNFVALRNPELRHG